MSTYLLLHGAWHGAWCWHKLIPLLERSGHEVLAPDLPGLGDDTTSVTDIDLEAYTQAVCMQLDALDAAVVLVGHSMSGIVISQVAERKPEKIRCLVYLAAFLLPAGKTVLETAQADRNGLVLPNLVFSRDKRTATVKSEAVNEVFYGDCAEEDAREATKRLVAQALTPLSTPVTVTEENWGRVPRYYIECTLDRAVSIECQREMLAKLPCNGVMSLTTSHSPFLSAPGQLLRLLLSCNG